MMGGAESKVEIGLARARGQLSCNGVSELSLVGEMLGACQAEGDRFPHSTRGCEQADIADHSTEFGGPMFLPIAIRKSIS